MSGILKVSLDDVFWKTARFEGCEVVVPDFAVCDGMLCFKVDCGLLARWRTRLS